MNCLLIRYKAKAQKPADLIAVWGPGKNANCHANRDRPETIGGLLAYVNAGALVNNFGDVEAKALDQTPWLTP